MTRKEFDDFLARQVKSPIVEDTDWEKRLAEWTASLDELYKHVDSFLHSFVENKKIAIAYGLRVLEEEHLGTYEVPSANISFGSNSIQILPIGHRIIGARGRVDMIGPKGNVRFVLVPENSTGPSIQVHHSEPGNDFQMLTPVPYSGKWSWKILTPPPTLKYLALTEESFLDSLMEVSNG
jgi:hypothetical protein